MMPKRQRYNHLTRKSSLSSAGKKNPRPINDRERTLITLYSYCQLAMTPQQFYAKWDVTHNELALICSRSISTVQRWFTKGRHSSHPHPNDLRHLALMDFLLEHFEEIPKALFDLLCSRQ